MKDVHIGFSDTEGGLTGSEVLISNGPTLEIQIGYDPGFVPGRKSVPALGPRRLEALVDTGAADSCIDVWLASELGLQIINYGLVSGSNGVHTTPIYLAQIYIPSLEYVQTGRFAGVKLYESGQSHKALIGRRFLKQCHLNYDGRTGRVTLSHYD